MTSGGWKFYIYCFQKDITLHWRYEYFIYSL